MTRKLRIAHLYPEMLNLYGDRGNITALRQRLAWRGIESELTEIPAGVSPDFNEFDFFLIGGGEEYDHAALEKDLRGDKGAKLRAAVEDGKTFFCVCAGFELMGKSIRALNGQTYEALGAVNFTTTEHEVKRVGYYGFDLLAGDGYVVGFESHRGSTELGEGAEPLGRVFAGTGNNADDSTEGVHYKNVFGTYCQGPALPINPAFCDLLLSTALERKYGDGALEPLDDSAELAAHEKLYKKITKK